MNVRMNLEKTLFLFLIFVFAASTVCAELVPDTDPARFEGSVQVDGEDDTSAVIDAYINGVLNDEATVRVYDDSTYVATVAGEDGDAVTFKIYGISVSGSTTFSAYAVTHKDLSVTKIDNGDSCTSYTGYVAGNNVENLGCAGGYCVWGTCWNASWRAGDSHCDNDLGESQPTDCQSGGTIGGGGGGGVTTPITTVETPIVTLPVVPEPVPSVTANASPQTPEVVIEETPPQKVRVVVNKFETVMGVSETYTFYAAGESHTASVLDLNEKQGTVRILLESKPQSFLLKVGKQVSVDLNADKVTDLLVTLTGFAIGKAQLLFEEVKLVPKAEPAKEETVAKPAPVTGAASKESEEPVPLGTGVFVLIGLGLIVIALFFVLKIRRKNKA